MTPLTLVPPTNLPTIRFPMLLRVALSRLDGGTRVDEQEARHGEGSERGGHSAGIEVEVAGFGRHCVLFWINLFRGDKMAIASKSS